VLSCNLLCLAFGNPCYKAAAIVVFGVEVKTAAFGVGGAKMKTPPMCYLMARGTPRSCKKKEK